MEEFDKHLLDKFFNDSCTPEQAEQVLDWLDTTEGQEYLEERLQGEIEEYENDREKKSKTNASNKNQIDPAFLFNKIMLRLGWGSLKRKRTFFMKPIIQLAASILVIATATLFYLNIENSESDVVISETVIYMTNSDQQKLITLRDGSTVRLNSNSTLTIEHGYNVEKRMVSLEGEAFFDILHNPVKPFIVHSDKSIIEVLGTSFNVNLNSGQKEIGVAVIEGTVSLRHSETATEKAVFLKKGQYASLNSTTREIRIDNYGTDNYLAWKSGRFVFEQLTMTQVCIQLHRLYGVTCGFVGDKIENRELTADFSSKKVETTLSVIAATLDLRYEKRDDRVLWYIND